MRSGIARVCIYCLGLMMSVYSVGSHLLAAAPVATPEIDGGSVAAGLGLLTGAILILRSRRRTK